MLNTYYLLSMRMTIIIGNNIEGITRLKQFLQQYFETKYHVLQLPPWGV